MGEKRRLPIALLVVGVGLTLIGVVAALGYLLAALTRMLLASGSPLGAAVGLGGVVVAGLGASIFAVRAAATRMTVGSTTRRTLFLSGLVLLMALAPFTMIAVVVALALQGGL